MSDADVTEIATQTMVVAAKVAAPVLLTARPHAEYNLDSYCVRPAPRTRSPAPPDGHR